MLTHSSEWDVYFSGSPSKPQDVAVVSWGATWAYVTWEEPISPGFPSTSVRSYAVLATRTEDGSTRLTPPVADLSVNITGLLPNTDYLFLVTAQSSVGEVVARSPLSEPVAILTITTGS